MHLSQRRIDETAKYPIWSSVKTVNGFKLLTILTKTHIQGTWQGPQPTSGFEQVNQNQI